MANRTLVTSHVRIIISARTVKTMQEKMGIIKAIVKNGANEA